MKYLLIGITCMLHSVFCFSQKANFSSKWTLSEAKSDFGGQPFAAMYQELNVSQSAETINVDGGRYNGTRTAINYPLDGKPVSTVMPNKRTVTTTITWSADGTVMTMNSSYSQADNPGVIEYNMKEIWSLAPDKKYLMIQRDYSYTNGMQLALNAVYEKQ